MCGELSLPNEAFGMPHGTPRLPNGGRPKTEAWAAGVPLGEFALLDVDRRRRTGVPEVVFGEGKTSEQIFALLAELRARDPEALFRRRKRIRHQPAGLDLASGDLTGERTTPTGAALLAAAALPGGFPAMTVRAVGTGVGGPEIPGRPSDFLIEADAQGRALPVAR